MLLHESLRPYFKAIQPEDKKKALRALSHFILTNDYKEYRDRIKELSRPAYDLFYKDVRNFVKSSFECRKIWRAVRCSLQSGDSFEKTAKDFGADVSGMKLVWTALLDEDKKAVEEASKKDNFGSMSNEALADLVTDLDKYCGRVAYMKLRFLSDNDNSFDLSDLRAELLAHGIQVVRLYEHTNDIKMIENYAKASVQNHAVNLIQHFTSEARACVKNATVGCGTCIFCLTDKPQRCPQAVADYRVTTLSMEGLALGTLGRVNLAAEDRMNNESLLDTLKEGTSAEFQRIIDLVFGADTDDAFEAWLAEQYNVTVDFLSDNPKRLVKALCRYLDVPPKEVSDLLRERYESYKNKVA